MKYAMINAYTIKAPTIYNNNNNMICNNRFFKNKEGNYRKLDIK